MTREQCYDALASFLRMPGCENGRMPDVAVWQGQINMKDLVEHLFTRCGSGLLPQDEARLDERYKRYWQNGNKPPKFDTSDEGIENIAMRCVKDYCTASKPEHALPNATSWIRQSIQLGRLEQQAADRKAVAEYFDHQARKLSDAMRLSS